MSYIESAKIVFGFLGSLLGKKKEENNTLPIPTPQVPPPEPAKLTYTAAIKFIASPNFNLRNATRPIKCIIIHHTAGSFQSAINWFQNKDSKVSAHYVISRKGEIVQMVEESKRAWHAGASEWLGEKDLNSISVGIELEGDGVTPFTEEQLAANVELCKQIKTKYNIEDRWIVGHYQVCPGRKTDPSPWDWNKFYTALNG